jgi:hypothetical protein
MYDLFLAIHNILRWVVLILAVYALFRAYSGWLGRRSWTVTDRKAGTFFGVGMDIQLLVGLLLYFVFSPLTRVALQNISGAMSSRELAFFAFEHGVAMLIAVVLVHVGSVFAKRASSDLKKHRAAAIWYTIATLAMLVAIPWWRPLLPL